MPQMTALHVIPESKAEDKKPIEPPKDPEFKATFIEVFGDRFKSHTLGGFALAWLAIHWEAVYVTLVLSTEDLPTHNAKNEQLLNKLDYIRTLDYSWWNDFKLALWVALLVPVIATFFDEIVIKLVKKWLSDLGLLLRGNFSKTWVVEGEDFKKLEAKYDEARVERARLDRRVRDFEEREKDLERRETELEASKEAYKQRGAEMEETVGNLSNELTTYKNFRMQLPSLISTLELVADLVDGRDFEPRYREAMRNLRDLRDQTTLRQ